MARVLMGWELGAGLGHVANLLAMAESLRQHGHESVFAIINVLETAGIVRAAGFPVLEAPHWRPRPLGPGGRVPPTAGFADILAFRGFEGADKIRAITTVWDGLIDTINPALAVADYAPGLCLAAKGRLPLMAVGNGFTLPPAELDRFPPLQPRTKPLVRQEDLLEAVNRVQRDRRQAELSRLPQIMEADGSFVTVLPMFDPYLSVRAEPVDGPIETLPEPLPAPPAPRVFAYMGVEVPGVKTFLRGLAASGLPASVFLRGATPEVLEKLAHPNIEFLDAPPPLTEALGNCSIAAHYGGLGTAVACLTAGRPQLMLPRQLERRLNARAVEKLGAGLVLGGKETPEDVAQALKRLVDEPQWAERATEISHEINDLWQKRGGLERIVGRCLELIEGGP